MHGTADPVLGVRVARITGQVRVRSGPSRLATAADSRSSAPSTVLSSKRAPPPQPGTRRSSHDHSSALRRAHHGHPSVTPIDPGRKGTRVDAGGKFRGVSNCRWVLEPPEGVEPSTYALRVPNSSLSPCSPSPSVHVTMNTVHRARIPVGLHWRPRRRPRGDQLICRRADDDRRATRVSRHDPCILGWPYGVFSAASGADLRIRNA